jgi:ATP-binding cassette subfamily F protein uup
VGGYSDWLAYRKSQQKPTTAQQVTASVASNTANKNKNEAKESKPRKLSYKEQRELDSLPTKIEALEQEHEQLQVTISDAGFYQQPKDEMEKTLARMEAVATELEQCYQRWQALDL